MLTPLLVGRRFDDFSDLAVVTALGQRAVARNFGAKAAVDAALHDLLAQAEGTSVSALLGIEPSGIRNVLVTDVTLSAGEAAALGETARRRVAEGFTTLKMKVGTDAATDVARVSAVRDLVGADVAIRLDANQGWTREEAVEVIRALEAAEPTTAVSDLDAARWSVASPVEGGISYSGNEDRLPDAPGLGITGWA